jgi:hypothetical protein
MAKGKKTKTERAQYSPLASHRREGKSFIPPFMQNPNITLMSWRDTRVPELLWAILLAGNLERDSYLRLFREVIRRACKTGEQRLVGTLQHSSLVHEKPDVFEQSFGGVFSDDQASNVLPALLLFDGLPDREHWAKHLPAPDPENHWHVLSRAVARTTDHQSQESTDCRWLRVFLAVTQKKMLIQAELEREIAEYPNLGDMRMVRPLIRSAEAALDQSGTGFQTPPWADNFWNECWTKTDCAQAHRRDEPVKEISGAVTELGQIYAAAMLHFRRTLRTTGIDPRHDAAFGLVMYGINLAYSVCIGEAHQRVVGRTVIRSMTECYITLAFLLKRDQLALWQKYRSYGSGQAKLAFLKSFDLEDPSLPEYLDPTELEAMANEDAWLEFVTIDVGNWTGLDLRKMSEEANVKPIYDKYYTWPSGYVHGQWGAVRDTNFGICLNPLHRFHRIPAPPRVSMGSVAPAAFKLTNLLLELLNAAYPTFKPRMTGLPPQSFPQESEA